MNTFLVSTILLTALAACGSSESTGLPTGVATSGLPLYSAQCMSCHGITGTGLSGPSIISKSASGIQTAVRNGPGDMPAWTESEISDQDLADIIAYIDSL
jgi:ubiquinol-cytochrome c reductase cytochrome c subunit